MPATDGAFPTQERARERERETERESLERERERGRERKRERESEIKRESSLIEVMQLSGTRTPPNVSSHPVFPLHTERIRTPTSLNCEAVPRRARI